MTRWPVFNFADVAIIIGVTILLVSSKSIFTNEQDKIMSQNKYENEAK
jgi:lipoprotein signal peptidase